MGRLKTLGERFRDFQSQNLQITKSTMLLLIRNHPLHFAEIAIAYQRGRSQVAFAFLGLGAQHVAQAGMSALHLAVGRLLEALGGAFVRFQFRHKSSQSAAGRQLPAASWKFNPTFKLLWNRWRDARPSY